ncbi:MAG: hypothetical protein GXO19_01600, partial [Epsilonproteobacteria bacterium]|nr:hypothetical protein [Campylobacterota bacterium]NPA56410.1 hypothetical protein [Campylobacterota bacterium]
NPDWGGDSSKVQSQLHNVKTIFSTWGAFAALREDGTVVTWGDPEYGGDSSLVVERLKGGVSCIFPMYMIPPNIDLAGVTQSPPEDPSLPPSDTPSQYLYLNALNEFLLQQREFPISGYFYIYDFNRNGRVEYNDWIYVTPNFFTFRLLAVTPTPKNTFGFQQISFPYDLNRKKLKGYFIYLGQFPLDRDSKWKFSWLYIDNKTKKVYKLVGATPDNRFRYLDIDGDGSADNILDYIPLTMTLANPTETKGYTSVIFQKKQVE